MARLRNAGIALAASAVLLCPLVTSAAKADSPSMLGGGQSFSFDSNLSSSSSGSFFDASGSGTSNSSSDGSLFPNDYDYTDTSNDQSWNASLFGTAVVAVGGALYALLDHSGSSVTPLSNNVLGSSSVEQNSGSGHKITPTTAPEASSFLSLGALLAGGCLLIVLQKKSKPQVS